MNANNTLEDLQVFLSSISAKCTQREIEDFISSFGHYSNLKFNKRSEDLNNSTASVTFKSRSSFNRIISEQPFFIHGVKLKVEQYAKNEERMQIEDDISRRRIYVKNIPFETEDDQFFSLFSAFGAIETCYICKQKRYEGSVTDYGFVTFVEESDARQVLERGTIPFPEYNCVIFVNEFKAKGHSHKKDADYWKSKYDNRTNEKSESRTEQARRKPPNRPRMRMRLGDRQAFEEKKEISTKEHGYGYQNGGDFMNGGFSAFPYQNDFYGFANPNPYQLQMKNFQNMNQQSLNRPNGGKYDDLYQKMFMKFMLKFQTAVNFSDFCEQDETHLSAWEKISEEVKFCVDENHDEEKNLRLNWK